MVSVANVKSIAYLQSAPQYILLKHLLLKIWTNVSISRYLSEQSKIAYISYCFYEYAFVLIAQTLLTSSCTLHSRYFPTSHRYIFLIAFLYHLYVVLCNPINDCISQIQACIHISVFNISTCTSINPV